MPKILNLVGQKFGKLIVLEKTSATYLNSIIWKCECICGKFTYVISSYLKSVSNASCGCHINHRNKLPFGEAARNDKINKYKKSARSRNLEFDLTDSEMINLFSKPCCICGVINHNKSNIKTSNGDFEYNGIDRINNDLGYIISNVRTMCIICNRAKHILTEVKFQEWLSRVRNNNANG